MPQQTANGETVKANWMRDSNTASRSIGVPFCLASPGRAVA